MKFKRCALLLILLSCFVLSGCGGPEDTYKSAQALLAKGEYAKAGEKFESIGSYEDAATLTMYCKACAMCESGDYEAGLTVLATLGGFKDSIYRITYYTAREYEDVAGTDDWECMLEAQDIYKTIPAFLDSGERIAALDKRIETVRNKPYDAAVALENEGKYSEAYIAFVELDGYRDSTTRANAIFSSHPEIKYQAANVGSYITFGTYEQDNETSNGKEDIEWLVLSKQNNRLLVLSRYALDCEQYHDKFDPVYSGDVTWENCTLRTWLNKDFLNAAFSSVEQAMIPAVTVSADKNPLYSTDPGKETQDKVFLLSIVEVNKYFKTDSEQRCKPTVYAYERGVHTDRSGWCTWWLRSPGEFRYCAASVKYDGSEVDYWMTERFAIRPALWIEIPQ